MAPHIVIPNADNSVTIRREGDRVLLIKGGVAILDVPAEAAVAIGAQLAAKGRLAQEERPRVAEQLAFDSALLLRTGAPFGVTSNPKILAMAKTEAESNRELRRYLPGGIKGVTQFGRPGVRHG